MPKPSNFVKKVTRPPSRVQGTIIVLDLGGGAVEEVDVGDRVPRFAESIGTRSWTHVGQDIHGRWIYRPA